MSSRCLRAVLSPVDAVMHPVSSSFSDSMDEAKERFRSLAFDGQLILSTFDFNRFNS